MELFYHILKQYHYNILFNVEKAKPVVRLGQKVMGLCMKDCQTAIRWTIIIHLFAVIFLSCTLFRHF